MANERYADDGTPMADCCVCNNGPYVAAKMLHIDKEFVCIGCGMRLSLATIWFFHDQLMSRQLVPADSIPTTTLRDQILVLAAAYQTTLDSGA